MKLSKKIFLFTLASSLTAMAQQPVKKDSINTQEVVIVSAYNASLNDTFKIETLPSLEQDKPLTKKQLNYKILEVPVASTFTPEKGSAAEVTPTDSIQKTFSNYALLGMGNYQSIKAQIGIVEAISEDIFVDASLRHRSSFGKIKNVELNNDYANSLLQIGIGTQKEDNNWQATIGFGQWHYNFYGLPENLSSWFTNILKDKSISQNYQRVALGGKFETKNATLKSIEGNYRYFWHQFGLGEHQLVFKPNFSFDFNKVHLNLNFTLDYLSASQNNLIKSNTSFLNFIAEPSLYFSNDIYELHFGAGIAYINGQQDNNPRNRFVVYPKVYGNIEVVKDLMHLYAGAQGGIEQNSYASLSEKNPFIAPNLTLLPTLTLYDFFVGAKGKFYHNFSYNARLGYKSQQDKALFALNGATQNNREVYQYGNSFDILYDRLTTLSVSGELDYELSNKLHVGLSGEINNYNLLTLSKAYNLPELKAGIKARYNINAKWYAGLETYLVGQRYDRAFYELSEKQNSIQDTEVKQFADVNLYGGYRPAQQWTIFLQANNLLNQSYMQWQNYRVQGLQIMAGAIYKFNFNRAKK